MRMKLARVILAVATVLIVSVSAYAVEGYLSTSPSTPVEFTLGPSYRDLTYCNAQTLDLFVPRGPAGPRPLVIYVHGGGMNSGDKSDLSPLFLNALASAGYAVASLNYRLAPQSMYPAQIEDVKCGIRFLRSSAQEYRLNSSEFYAFGTSAGGQLVSIAALTGGDSVFDVGPYMNETSSLRAVVDMFGPADLNTCNCYSDPQPIFGPGATEETLASPTHFVVPGAPPIMIIQGLNDTTVPWSQATEFYTLLRDAGDTAQLVLVSNMGHMFVQAGPKPMNPDMVQIARDMVDFFETH